MTELEKMENLVLFEKARKNKGVYAFAHIWHERDCLELKFVHFQDVFYAGDYLYCPYNVQKGGLVSSPYLVGHASKLFFDGFNEYWFFSYDIARERLYEYMTSPAGKHDFAEINTDPIELSGIYAD